MIEQVSVIIMTKNEAAVIERCIRNLSAFREIFVVDSGSQDATAAIASELGANVVEFSWDGRYPKKKQWCLENLPLTSNWVLYIDADEIMTPELSAEIDHATKEAKFVAFDAPLAYHFLGRPLRHGHRISKRILIDRRSCRFPVVDDLGATTMWEVEGHYQPLADGPVGTLKNRLGHEDLDRLYDYFSRHNRYSDWEAYLAAGEESSRSAVDQARSQGGRRAARVPFKPLVFFLYAYVLRLGMLDGRAGFHYAVSQAFYYWQISIKRQELMAARGSAVTD